MQARGKRITKFKINPGKYDLFFMNDYLISFNKASVVSGQCIA